MLSGFPSWLFLAIICFFTYALKRFSRYKSGLPLPPGPKGLPILGNVFDVPSTNMMSTFRDMNAKYGDLVYLNVLGRSMVIIGAHSTAVELLDKRSAIYSGRTPSIMTELSGWGWLFASQSYGASWRRHRKLFRRFFNPTALLPFRPIQERDARRLTLRVMQEPEGFLEHIRFNLAATMLQVTYGLHIEDPHDEHVALAEAAVAILNIISVPGRYIVEVFPTLRFLPSWLPGAKFKREGESWTPVVHRMRDAPWQYTLDQIRNGSAVSSVASSLMKDMPVLEGKEADEAGEVARNVAAVVYAAGGDTTMSVAQTFFLAMASSPEAQKKAQIELDSVVGPHRLPSLSDRASLPYMAALLKECLRWQVVGPFGLPHCSTEDDEFRGYLIPKGTTVITNLWAFSRDTKYYPDPTAFMPERFLKDGQLNPDVLDPTTFVFGYGRRGCPGRHFAEDSLFLIATTVLHTLSINAPLDAWGNPVKPEGKMTPGLISYPEPFDVDIRPRGPWAEALLRECSNAPIMEAS